MRLRLALLVAITSLTVVALGAPAVAAGDPCFHSLSRPAPTTNSTTRITIDDCTFGPTITHVAVGAEVVWANKSSQAHEVVGANLAWGAHDKLLEPGDSIGWSFDSPGIYPYTCMLHPGMSGAVVVGGAAALGAGSLPAGAGPGAEVTPPQAEAPADPGGVASVLAPAVALTGGLGFLGVVGWLGLARRRRSAA